MRLPEFSPAACLPALLLVLVTTLISACGINNIPTYDKDVNERWAELFTQYEHRIELVPDLVRTVEGFAQHEKKVLIQVNDTHELVSRINVSPEMLTNPETMRQYQSQQDALTHALQQLMNIAEPQPDLNANENFLTLQQELQELENRIAIAHRDYIGAVQRYNTELRTIPGRWWASFMYSTMQPKATLTSKSP